jgi:hypothetical protein
MSFSSALFYSPVRVLNQLGLLIDGFYGFRISVHDPWITGLIDGDTDDWVAINELIQRENAIIYVPGKRYEIIKDFVLRNNLSVRIIGPGHPYLEWFVKNAHSVCKCAPLTHLDMTFLHFLRNRPDNSLNAAQGQTFDPTVNGPNYNFKATMANCHIDKDELDSLFPRQFPSDLTKQHSVQVIQDLPPVLRDLVNAFAVLKVVCPPPPHLPFAVGLLDPAAGKASNATECMYMLAQLGFGSINPDTPEFFAKLVEKYKLRTDSSMIQEYVAKSNTARPLVLANALAGIVHLAQQAVRVDDTALYYSESGFARLDSLTNIYSRVRVDPPLYDLVAVLAWLNAYSAERFIREKPKLKQLLIREIPLFLPANHVDAVLFARIVIKIAFWIYFVSRVVSY